MANQKQRVQEMVASPFIRHRVLSLDGGGSWALLQAMILDDLFPDEGGHQVLNRFDTVTANSGGSIVAACLAIDMAPREIVAFFKNPEARGRMFTPVSHNIFRDFPQVLADLAGVGYRYYMEEKQKQLHKVLGGITLGDLDALNPALLIMGFDYDTRGGKIFRSRASLTSSSARNKDAAILLADAVNASTNAPVLYFDEPAPIGNSRYWDGAVAGFNNPVLVGVTEALAHSRTSPMPYSAAQIGVLSIGTGNSNLPVLGRCENSGQGKDFLFTSFGHDPKGLKLVADNIQKLGNSIVSEPPSWATFAAYIAAGHTPADLESNRFFRLNPMIQPWYDDHTWTCPSVLSDDDFKNLLALDMDATAQSDVELIEKFGLGYLAGQIPNQGIQKDSSTLKVTIGYGRYFDADPLVAGPPAPPADSPGGNV